MDIKAQIVSSAESLFDRHGFTATGMDRLTEAAGVSSRTLYKHIGGRAALIAAVLEERERRFFSRLKVRSVDALFAALEEWTRSEGARGCLFLRAQGETGGDTPEVSGAVAAYRQKLRQLMMRVVANEIGRNGREALADHLLLLFEGATSVASYRGVEAIANARVAAAILVERARRP